MAPKPAASGGARTAWATVSAKKWYCNRCVHRTTGKAFWNYGDRLVCAGECHRPKSVAHGGDVPPPVPSVTRKPPPVAKSVDKVATLERKLADKDKELQKLRAAAKGGAAGSGTPEASDGPASDDKDAHMGGDDKVATRVRLDELAKQLAQLALLGDLPEAVEATKRLTAERDRLVAEVRQAKPLSQQLRELETKCKNKSAQCAKAGEALLAKKQQLEALQQEVAQATADLANKETALMLLQRERAELMRSRAPVLEPEVLAPAVFSFGVAVQQLGAHLDDLDADAETRSMLNQSFERVRALQQQKAARTAAAGAAPGTAAPGAAPGVAAGPDAAPPAAAQAPSEGAVAEPAGAADDPDLENATDEEMQSYIAEAGLPLPVAERVGAAHTEALREICKRHADASKQHIAKRRRAAGGAPVAS